MWIPDERPIELVDIMRDTDIITPHVPDLHTHWLAIDGKRPNIPEN
jgi:hypothetical protein